MRSAKIEYDPEIDMFRGEILGLNGGADFYGKTTKELHDEFEKSLEVFLKVCKEKNAGFEKNLEEESNHKSDSSIWAIFIRCLSRPVFRDLFP